MQGCLIILVLRFANGLASTLAEVVAFSLSFCLHELVVAPYR